MERLTKRYFWVINLVLLAVLAWLSARVINNIIAGEIVALPTSVKAVAAVEPKKAGQESKADWAATITNRNLFNSTPPEPEDETDAGPTETPEVALDGVPPPGTECKKSEASLGLTATMVAEPSEWSMAVVDDGVATEARLVREGQKLTDVVVAAIQRERIVLARGAAFECIELGERKGGRKGPTGATAEPLDTGGGDTGGGGGNSKIKDGVKKTGANAYEIDRAMLDEQLADLNNLGKQARVIPHYRDGKPQGFKVVGVRPGSLYSHIGVRSGDVLQSVNGEEITSPNKALELYERLKNSDNVTVDVERRGRKVTLEYQIK